MGNKVSLSDLGPGAWFPRNFQRSRRGLSGVRARTCSLVFGSFWEGKGTHGGGGQE